MQVFSSPKVFYFNIFLCQIHVIPATELQSISTGESIVNLEAIMTKLIMYRILIYIIFHLYFPMASDQLIYSDWNSFLRSKIKLRFFIKLLSLWRPLSPSQSSSFKTTNYSAAVLSLFSTSKQKKSKSEEKQWEEGVYSTKKVPKQRAER